MKQYIINAMISCLLLITGFHAEAWVYFEHRGIALLAIQQMNPAEKAWLQEFWSMARLGSEGRLTDSVIVISQGRGPQQLDYASWAAIAGDHSCSAQELINNVLHTEWILQVADISAELRFNVESSKNNAQRANFLHISDIKLQRADPGYATRAGTNNVHFLLPRPDVNTTPAEYLRTCFVPGAPLNALGAYAWFHISAVMKAARFAQDKTLSKQQKSALALAALADEAFALHFLEDVFAAGHIAGTWGKTSVRKGTHDYYNEKGLEASTWEGKRLILMGDVYMRPQDAELAAIAIRLSIEQVIKAGMGNMELDYANDPVSLVNEPDSFSVCSNAFNKMRQVEGKFIVPVLAYTPVPGLANGLGELPRFRSELGTYLGISSSLNVANIAGGFGKEQNNHGWVGGIDANLRFGLGVEGVIDQSADGQIFFQFGWRLDGPSTNEFAGQHTQLPPGSLTAAVPGRSAYNLRIRMPFWLIPGDMLIAGPILYFISPATLVKMGVVAASGGLIPIESIINTSIGKIQFVLGRELGVSLYGLSSTKDQVLIPATSGAADLLYYKSIQFDFPFLEYQPFRTFSFDQTSGMMVQFFAGFDVPYDATVISPAGAKVPELKTLWNAGLRVIFNWRRYF
jgi:hypothetical protein